MILEVPVSVRSTVIQTVHCQQTQYFHWTMSNIKNTYKVEMSDEEEEKCTWCG